MTTDQVLSIIYAMMAMTGVLIYIAATLNEIGKALKSIAK